MPLSAAEKMRRYRARIKADKQRNEEYLRKDRERWKERTENGKVKKISELSKREQRAKRKAWRISQRRHTEANRRNRDMERALPSPPLSPSEQGNGNLSESGTEQQSAQKRRGRKTVRKDRSAAYRKVKKLEQQVDQLKAAKEKYRKRWHRVMGIHNQTPDTPRRKANTILKDTQKARKTLTLHFALTEELRQKMALAKSQKHKQVLSRIIAGKILSKYRLLKFAKSTFGYPGKRNWSKTNGTNYMQFYRKQQKNKLSKELIEKVTQFYENDKNSRMMPGKKDTVTRKKERVQKRLLNDTIKNIHAKFVKESSPNISYSAFRKLKPFWVLIPSVKDRETCLCKTCENAKFMQEKLTQLKILSSGDSIESIIEKLCCGSKQKECFYRECLECINKTLDLHNNREEGMTGDIFWWRWEKVEEKISGEQGNDQTVKRWVKTKVTGKVVDLLAQFEDYLKDKLSTHVYNIRHQFKALSQVKRNLLPNEAVVQIDFAENWQCKYAKEIQSVHFGASHLQVTLHNAVVNLGSETLSFSTISDSRRHDAVAIWTFLEPVLNALRNMSPSIEKLHIQSDGPTTQYRNKTNMFLMSTKPFAMGFTEIYWNFSEAGHGKGAPDGIGAALKRAGDSLAAQGVDIPDAQTFYQLLKEQENSKITLFYIAHQNIPKEENVVPKVLRPITGTMKIHQLFSNRSHMLNSRVLSCYCSYPDKCNCHMPANTQFPALGETHQVDQPIPTTNSDNPTDSQMPQRNVLFLMPVSPETPGLLGQWCAVLYDNQVYPGVITACEDELEVKTMNRVGYNKFVWPQRPDIVWYEFDRVLGIIPEPTRVSSRRDIFQIEQSIWDKIFD